MAKFPDGWRAGMNVPILFSLSQAGKTSRNIFFRRANTRRPTGFIAAAFET
jgi:hypothetical protein